jgi:hypothetical protein
MVQHAESIGSQEYWKITEPEQKSCYIFERDVDSVNVYS